jgi:hypothetical protein
MLLQEIEVVRFQRELVVGLQLSELGSLAFSARAGLTFEHLLYLSSKREWMMDCDE